MLSEFFVPQQHSTSKIVPQRKPDAFPYEPSIGQAGTLRLSIELRKEPACTQEYRRSNLSDCCSIATPRPLPWILRHLCSYGIENNVSRYLEEVAFLLNEDCLESPLKDMSSTLMSPVERLRIDTVEMPHATREIGSGRLNQQVIMV